MFHDLILILDLVSVFMFFIRVTFTEIPYAFTEKHEIKCKIIVVVVSKFRWVVTWVISGERWHFLLVFLWFRLVAKKIIGKKYIL